MTPHTNPANVVTPDLVFATTSTTELTLRMLVALTIILTLMWITTKQTRRYLNTRNNTGPRITIQHQQQLTKHTNLTLLTTGTHNLLIATNQHTTTLLAQGPHLTTNPNNTNTTTATAGAGAGAGAGIDIRTKPNPLKTLQNKTVRR